MKKMTALLTGFALLAASTAMAASLKTYQATGQVLEVRDDAVVVQKGKEKWEIAKDKDSKVTGDLKAGSKATVTYTMKAVTIEAKADAKKETKKK
jgi:hypothetical protein